jgi:hypothetical protein
MVSYLEVSQPKLCTFFLSPQCVATHTVGCCSIAHFSQRMRVSLIFNSRIFNTIISKETQGRGMNFLWRQITNISTHSVSIYFMLTNQNCEANINTKIKTQNLC